jgi:tripartite-type tricarboxylate transporter receptor subunit TctC
VGTLAANASLYKQLPYNVLTDFIPLASVGDAPQVLSVRADLPARNFDEFVAYSRAHGATMNFGDAGTGSGSFLGAILMNAAIGAKVTPVHYRGAAQATADVMAGHIDYTIESSSTAVSSISTKKIKGLVVLRSERVPVLPDVPAITETGFPDLRYDIWNMLLVPKGVPPARVQSLNAAINRVLASPDIRDRFVQMGVAVPSAEHRSLGGSAELLKSEVARWKDLLEKAGIQPEGS